MMARGIGYDQMIRSVLNSQLGNAAHRLFARGSSAPMWNGAGSQNQA